MRWVAVHHDLVTNPKFMALPMEGRGAWLTLLVYSSANTPRGTLRNRATAEAIIARELKAMNDGSLGVDVGDLIDRGWIDEDAESGVLTMHDFEEWQRAMKKPSDQPERILERVHRHRGKSTPSPAPPSPEIEERRVTRGNALQTLATNDLYALFRHLVGRVANSREHQWIDDLVKEQGDRGVVGQAMLADTKPTEGNLLGRVSYQLRGNA